jgi:hypothetical protein
MPLAVDFQGGVTSAWSNVITFVPKLAAALVIILVGYLVAKVVASVGVAITLQALVVLRFGTGRRAVPPALPDDPVRIGALSFSRDRIWFAALVVAITPLLDDRAPQLLVRDGTRTINVPHDDIVWIEAEDYCARIHLRDRTVLVRESLRERAMGGLTP